MQIVKQSVARDHPCILINNSDGYTPHTGVAEGSVTINYRKEGATSWTAKTATGNWTEVGKGVYLISWSTTDLNTIGRFDFIVEVSGDINYYGSLVISANLLDDINTAIGALNDLAQSDILSDATTFAGANINATISSRSSHTAIDARDAILSDSTPFAGANLDAAISSRSTHAAADVVALMNDLDASEILAAITTDSTKFAGALIANLDAAITTRSSHDAAAVDTQLSGTHGAGSWEGGGAAPTVAEIWGELQSGYTTPGTFGYLLDTEIGSLNDLAQSDILSDATPFAGGNIDAAITTRSSHSAAAVVALMNDLDASEILAAITTDSTKFAGANIDVAISSRSSHGAADVVALMNDLDASEILAAITSDSTKFAGALIANLDAAISSRSTHTAANVDTQLSGTHGAGSWEGGGAAPTVAEIWGELQSGYTTPGSFGYFLDSQVSAAGGGAAPTVAEIAEGVHDIKLSFNKTTGIIEIRMADDTLLTSATIIDTATEVTRA